MREVAPGITRLGSRHHNFYLLVEDGAATVVDTGGSREWPAVLRALAWQGLAEDAIEGVLITHGHTDHVGGARIADANGVTVKVHEDEAARVRGEAPQTQISPSDLPLWKPPVWLFLMAMVRAGAQRRVRVPGVATFADGEVLDLPGRPRAIHTPGHTEGHSAFHLERRRVLFSGDAVVTMDLLGGSRGPAMLDARFHSDDVQARASLGRLAGLATDLVLPGHGDPFAGSIDEALARVVR